MSDNNDKKRIIVTFRNDDPSGVSDVDHERRVADIFQRYGVCQTLAVVPFHTLGDTHSFAQEPYRALHENEAMVAFLKEYAQASGSEIALHGYHHKTNRLSVPKKREYFEFRALSVDEQERMIREGTEEIESTLGVRPVTFVPPWNRMDENTLEALERQGYRCISVVEYNPDTAKIVSFGTNCNPENFDAVYKAAKESDRQIFINFYYHSVTTTTEEQLARLEHAVRTIAQDDECEILTIGQACSTYEKEIRHMNEAAKNVVSFDVVTDSPRAPFSIYYKIYRRLVKRDPIAPLIAECKRAYRAGDYDASIARTQEIDDRFSNIGYTARAILGLLGLLVYLVAEALFSSASVAIVLSLVAVALIGVAGRAYVTARASKAEAVMAAVSMGLGSLAGYLLF